MADVWKIHEAKTVLDHDRVLKAVFDGVGIERAIPSNQKDLRDLIRHSVVEKSLWIKHRPEPSDPFHQTRLLALTKAVHSGFLKRHRNRFLTHEPLIFDIWPEALPKGEPVPITSEIYLGRVTAIAIHPKEQDFLLYAYIGRIPLFLYDLLRNITYVLVEQTEENIPGLITLMLAHLGSHNLTFADIFGNKGAHRWRYLVISDERPTHFVQETLGFLAKHSSGALSKFVDQGGRLAISRDRCLVNPIDIFPELSNADLLLTNTKNLICNFDFGSSCFHNIYRAPDDCIDREEVFRRLRPQSSTPENTELSSANRFDVFIVLDVEKSRFVNQFECLRVLVDRLAQLCSSNGRDLNIAFDGWTPNSFNASGNDKAKHRLACDLANDIMHGHECFWQVLADRPFLLKAREIGKFDLAITSHGTGALLPCKVLRLPTITFGTRSVTKKNYEIDPSCNYKVPQASVREFTEDKSKLFHRQRFELDIDPFCRFVLDIVGSLMFRSRPDALES